MIQILNNNNLPTHKICYVKSLIHQKQSIQIMHLSIPQWKKTKRSNHVSFEWPLTTRLLLMLKKNAFSNILPCWEWLSSAFAKIGIKMKWNNNKDIKWYYLTRLCISSSNHQTKKYSLLKTGVLSAHENHENRRNFTLAYEIIIGNNEIRQKHLKYEKKKTLTKSGRSDCIWCALCE